VVERTDAELLAAIRELGERLRGPEVDLFEALAGRVAERTPLSPALRDLSEGLLEALELRDGRATAPMGQAAGGAGVES
jgi:hypothetical protein